MSLKKLLLLMVMSLVSLCTFAQVTVSGVVISSDDNEPVIGATVKVKEKPSIGAATDMDGQFTLKVPSAKSHLEISYVGHQTQVVPVSTNGQMKIVLKSTSKNLGEVEVVATGMQKIDRRLFTGAATKVDADKAKLSGVADISRGLEGKVAGVQVQNVTGTFGTALRFACAVPHQSTVLLSRCGLSMVWFWRMQSRLTPTTFRRATP